MKVEKVEAVSKLFSEQDCTLKPGENLERFQKGILQFLAQTHVLLPYDV